MPRYVSQGYVSWSPSNTDMASSFILDLHMHIRQVEKQTNIK